ncbi:MAG: hypothetical protein WC683_06350 [bacterium]
MRDPWAQRLDETDTEYSLFVSWLGKPGVRRAIPSDLQLAVARDWSPRAAAYDCTAELPKDAVGRLRVGLERMTLAFAIEAGKIVYRAQTTQEQTLTPHQLARIPQMVARMIEAMKEANSELRFRPDTPDHLLEAVADLEHWQQ